MLDMYDEFKGRYGGWMVEAKAWVQDLKETGKGPPVGGAAQGLSSGDQRWGLVPLKGPVLRGGGLGPGVDELTSHLLNSCLC